MITRSKRKQDADKRLMIKFQFVEQNSRPSEKGRLFLPYVLSIFLGSAHHIYSQTPNNSNATNNSNFQGSTDSSPTCLEFSCNNGVTYTGQYCYEHKCFNATCTFKKNFNSNYCSVCECGYAGCHNAQISLGFYCYEHTCAKSGCNSQKSFNSNYCILHD